MESFDALSIAVMAAHNFFTDTDTEPTWGVFIIYRLLSGGGWLVEYSRPMIMLDGDSWQVAV